MSNYSEKQQALRDSRSDFERMLVQRYWDGLFEDCKSGTFEASWRNIANRLVRDGEDYAITGQPFAFQGAQQDWEIWKVSFEAGWEARDWSC